MSEAVLEKMNEIERLLLEINAKIDNFSGFEDLSNAEKEEIENLRDEVQRRELIAFEDVFSE